MVLAFGILQWHGVLGSGCEGIVFIMAWYSWLGSPALLSGTDMVGLAGVVG
jgi:hypothetical protein